MLNRVDYLEHGPAARLRDEQIYRPFRRELQFWRGQPLKGPINIAIVECCR